MNELNEIEERYIECHAELKELICDEQHCECEMDDREEELNISI